MGSWISTYSVVNFVRFPKSAGITPLRLLEFRFLMEVAVSKFRDDQHEPKKRLRYRVKKELTKLDNGPSFLTKAKLQREIEKRRCNLQAF